MCEVDKDIAVMRTTRRQDLAGKRFGKYALRKILENRVPTLLRIQVFTV